MDSTIKFHNNEATLGGAINCNSNSDITSKESANVIFSQNIAKLGGAIYTVIQILQTAVISHLLIIQLCKMAEHYFLTSSSQLFYHVMQILHSALTLQVTMVEPFIVELIKV